MKKLLLPFLAINVIVAGCASVETGAASQEPREEAVYRTGSNIPQKQKPGSADGVSTYDKEQLERYRTQSAPPLSQPGLPAPGGR
jgi:uncharacterized protein YceK